MKKTLTVLGIALLVAVFAYPVFGRGFGWGGGYMMGNWGGGPDMAETITPTTGGMET